MSYYSCSSNLTAKGASLELITMYDGLQRQPGANVWCILTSLIDKERNRMIISNLNNYLYFMSLETGEILYEVCHNLEHITHMIWWNDTILTCGNNGYIIDYRVDPPEKNCDEYLYSDEDGYMYSNVRMLKMGDNLIVCLDEIEVQLLLIQHSTGRTLNKCGDFPNDAGPVCLDYSSLIRSEKHENCLYLNYSTSINNSVGLYRLNNLEFTLEDVQYNFGDNRGDDERPYLSNEKTFELMEVDFLSKPDRIDTINIFHDKSGSEILICGTMLGAIHFYQTSGGDGRTYPFRTVDLTKNRQKRFNHCVPFSILPNNGQVPHTHCLFADGSILYVMNLERSQIVMVKDLVDDLVKPNDEYEDFFGDDGVDLPKIPEMRDLKIISQKRNYLDVLVLGAFRGAKYTLKVLDGRYDEDEKERKEYVSGMLMEEEKESRLQVMTIRSSSLVQGPHDIIIFKSFLSFY